MNPCLFVTDCQTVITNVQAGLKRRTHGRKFTVNYLQDHETRDFKLVNVQAASPTGPRQNSHPQITLSQVGTELSTQRTKQVSYRHGGNQTY